MDYLEGFLIGPVWSDTEYRSRRHFSAHVLLAAVMGAAFAALAFFPDLEADWVFVKWPLSLVLFVFLILVTPLLSLLYYRFPVYVRPVVLVLYVLKYLLVFYILVHYFLPLLVFEKQTLPDLLFTRVDNHITVSLETIAESGGILVTVAGVVLGGLWVIAEGIVIVMVLVAIPLCAIGLLKASQYFFDRVIKYSLEKEWADIGKDWPNDHLWRGQDEYETDVTDQALVLTDYESTKNPEESEVQFEPVPLAVGSISRMRAPEGRRSGERSRAHFTKNTQDTQNTTQAYYDVPEPDVRISGTEIGNKKPRKNWITNIKNMPNAIRKKILPEEQQLDEEPPANQVIALHDGLSDISEDGEVQFEPLPWEIDDTDSEQEAVPINLGGRFHPHITKKSEGEQHTTGDHEEDAGPASRMRGSGLRAKKPVKKRIRATTSILDETREKSGETGEELVDSLAIEDEVSDAKITTKSDNSGYEQ